MLPMFLKLGGPMTQGPLTLVPLYHPGEGKNFEYALFPEALARGEIAGLIGASGYCMLSPA